MENAGSEGKFCDRAKQAEREAALPALFTIAENKNYVKTRSSPQKLTIGNSLFCLLDRAYSRTLSTGKAFRHKPISKKTSIRESGILWKCEEKKSKESIVATENAQK